MKELDWNKVEKYLKDRYRDYAGIGVAGMFALQVVINPLLIRFERGERTQELYDSIFEIAE